MSLSNNETPSCPALAVTPSGAIEESRRSFARRAPAFCAKLYRSHSGYARSWTRRGRRPTVSVPLWGCHALRIVTLLLVSTVCVALDAPAKAATPAPDLGRQRTTAARVQITRDDWGIAHVHGKSDADAVFGMVYA